eukprot:224742_1
MPTTINDNNIWIQLAVFPKGRDFKYVAKINGNNFLVVGNGAVYNYNLQTNKWNVHSYGDFNSRRCAAALNNQLLYLLDTDAYLTTINVVDKTVQKVSKNPHYVDIYSAGFIINNEYHIIEGTYNNKQLKWNSQSNKWQTYHAFSELEEVTIQPNPVVNLKSKQKTFLFGGHRSDIAQHLDTVYEYNIQQNIWNKTNIKMPKPCCVGIPVPVIRGQFILFFGWYNHDAGYQDDIFIFSVSEQKFKISSIKCPNKSWYSAVAINDCKRDEKIVFGYVRKQWKLSPIPDHWFPPLYLLKLMARYFLIECIHILDEGYGNHWKINSLDIV